MSSIPGKDPCRTVGGGAAQEVEMEEQRDHRTAAFRSDLIAVYRQHGPALGHEGTQGAFEIRKLTDELVERLEQAIDRTAEESAPES